MRSLLKRLGNPHKKFTSVHIVGTSGKSSTAYLIAKIIQSTGYKVGLHISPHLQTMRERLQINGRLISRKEFLGLINQVKPITDKMSASRHGKPSYFEALLAAAFLYFAQQKVNLAIVEAGLGGKFDGTNVLQPKIVVLTNIGLDHSEILGKTKTAILKDKMQTIKPSARLVISGIKQKGLLKVLQVHCLKQNVPLLVYNQDFFVANASYKQNYSQFDFFIQSIKCLIPGIKQIREIKLNLPGIFQTENAALAIAASAALAEIKKFTLIAEQIKQGLSKASFPGRMETASTNPLILLDGGHNEDKIKALIKSIKRLYPNRKIIIVLGLKKDKKATQILCLLSKISRQFIITQFGRATDLGFQLHYPAKKLFLKAKRLLPKAKLFLEPNSQKAIKKARQLANNKTLILVTGSLYLVGEARKHFKLKPGLLIFRKP